MRLKLEGNVFAKLVVRKRTQWNAVLVQKDFPGKSSTTQHTSTATMQVIASAKIATSADFAVSKAHSSRKHAITNSCHCNHGYVGNARLHAFLNTICNDLYNS